MWNGIINSAEGNRIQSKAWLKSFKDKNIGLRKKTNNVFKRDFFELMNNIAFERTLQKVRNQKDIKLVTTDKKKKQIDVRA